MANRFVFPNVQRFDENGNPASGWKLAFYKPGTSTPKDTYSDDALTTPNTNPVIADADGVWPDIFMDGEYDVRELNADDVQKRSWDNVKGPIFAAVGGGDADDVPTNAYIGSFVPEILTSGTDTYTATFGRTIGTGETAVGDVQSANTTTTPTLNGDTVTTKDGSALWAGALEGVHKFQKAASSWLVLDPNPVIPDSTTKTGADDKVVSGTAGAEENLAMWNADGDAVDSGVSTADTLRKPGASSDPALAFDTWRTPNANRTTYVAFTLLVVTDGSNPGDVFIDVDESGGTTADYSFRVRLDASLTGSQSGVRFSTSAIVPAGASYQVRNAVDPSSLNAIETHREFTL